GRLPRTARSPGPPGPGLREISGSAGDLAGLQAAGAHVDALVGAVDRGADTLDVGVEAPLGDLVRPRPVVAEARLLGADVADGSHGSTPGVEGGTGPLVWVSKRATGKEYPTQPLGHESSGGGHHYPGSPAVGTGRRDPTTARGSPWKHRPAEASSSPSCSASSTSRSTPSPTPARRST